MHPSEVCEGSPRVTGKPESWHFSELIRYSLIHTVLRGGRFSVDPLCILFYKVYPLLLLYPSTYCFKGDGKF